MRVLKYSSCYTTLGSCTTTRLREITQVGTLGRAISAEGE